MALAEVADPGRAPAMQAYMKSTIPYWGVPSALMRQTCKAVFAEYPFASAEAWQKDVLAIFRGATHREERYAAIELSGDRRAKAFQTLDALPMYEELVVTGAWWDIVDTVAAHRLGPILVKEGAPMKRLMLRWAKDDDLWKRRSAILCQLTRKGATDLDLLYRAIEPSLASKEFFLRKAIGWALRQLAWTSPDEVRRYVREHEAALSPLSVREALKNLS
jgi:3-methyladenine DNA glycosylase AlkD